MRADPPQPTLAAPEVKMIISQPRRIAAKALAERVRSCEPDLAHKIGLRSKFFKWYNIVHIVLWIENSHHFHYSLSISVKYFQWGTVLESMKQQQLELGL